MNSKSSCSLGHLLCYPRLSIGWEQASCTRETIRPQNIKSQPAWTPSCSSLTSLEGKHQQLPRIAHQKTKILHVASCISTYFNSGRQFLPWKRSRFKHVEVDLLGRPCWSEQPLPELELEELELELETTFTAPCMAGRSYQVHGGAVATAPGRACFGVLAPMLPACHVWWCLLAISAAAAPVTVWFVLCILISLGAKYVSADVREFRHLAALEGKLRTSMNQPCVAKWSAINVNPGPAR